MRKIDKNNPSFGKAAKTINFDKIVLEKLEEKARRDNSTVTNLVNTICKQIILKDENYYREMAKLHYLKFQEFNYMKEQIEIKKSI